ncbi:MAG: hypothetical protein ACYTE3_20475 [Planctomycetota bacterium]|jgi:hypothetical protein
MKDIDFLPEWYKSGVRREVSYRTQYMALGGIFLVMAVWSLATSHSVSKARAEFGDMAAMHEKAVSVSSHLAVLKGRFRSLQKRFASMEEIDSRIDVASVLAEMSFLIREEIVLSKVELIAERFPDKETDKASTRTGAVVRAVRVKKHRQQKLPLGNVRFKVVIAGVAADTRAVADLTSKLEESSYFFQVVPSLSKSTKLVVESEPSPVATTDAVRRTTVTRSEVSDAGKSLQATKFEIDCYLANYRKP